MVRRMIGVATGACVWAFGLMGALTGGSLWTLAVYADAEAGPITAEQWHATFAFYMECWLTIFILASVFLGAYRFSHELDALAGRALRRRRA